MHSQTAVPILELRRHSVSAAFIPDKKENVSDNLAFVYSLTAREKQSPQKTSSAKNADKSSLRSTTSEANVARSNNLSKYSSESSERTAVRLTAAQKLAVEIRKQDTQSTREPYKYPVPIDFRTSVLGSGKEMYLPQFQQLQQASYDAVAAAPPSPRFQTKRPQIDPHSSSAMSNVSLGTLDVRHKKLGDEYAYALVQEAVRVVGLGASSDDKSSIPSVPVDEKMKSMLAGVYSTSITSQAKNEDEEAYFDLSKPLALTCPVAHPLRTLCLRDNRLTDVGITRILQCLQGHTSFASTINANSASVGSATRAVRMDRERKCEIKAEVAMRTLTTLDLSENNMRRKGAYELSQLLRITPAMKRLQLSKMNIGDSALRCFFMADEALGESVSGTEQGPRVGSTLDEASLAIAPIGSIQLLPGDHLPLPGSLTLAIIDLSNNKIGDYGCSPLATLIKHTQALQELNLSWNEIKDKGAVLLAAAVGSNQTLQKLDISWNAIGTKSEVNRCVAKALSDMLAQNATLLHLDLSQNQLTTTDCAVISVGLAANHSIMGLHMTGNGGSLDAYGHLVPDAEPWPLESGHVATRIIGENFQTKDRQLRRLGGHDSPTTSPAKASKQSHARTSDETAGKWHLRNSCWVCGGFREHKFEYTLTQKSIRAILSATTPGSQSAPTTVIVPSRVSTTVADAQFTNGVENTSESNFCKEEVFLPMEIPASFPRTISVQLVTSFDKWVGEEMGRADHTSSVLQEKLKADVHYPVANLNLKGNQLSVDVDDHRACTRSASQFAFSEHKARKDSAESAVAAATNTTKTLKDAENMKTKGVKAVTVKTPKEQSTPRPPPGSPTKRTGRRTIKKRPTMRDPHVASITPEAFRAKIALLSQTQGGLAKNAMHNDEFGVSLRDAPSDISETHIDAALKQSCSHDAYDYGIDECDNLFAYNGGDTNPSNASEDDSDSLKVFGGHGTRKSTRVPQGNKRRPKYELHRMVPPGVHYYAICINGGELTFDPFKPHVRTARLVELGLYVPPAVHLPPFVNKISIEAPTEDEILQGVEALFTPVCKPRTKNLDAAVDMAPWTFKDSLFYHHAAKHEAPYIGRCFAKDWSYMRASKGKVQSDVDAVQSMLRKYYTLACAVFVHYAALYSTEVYFLGIGAFNEFIQRTKMIDGEQGGTRRTVLAASTNADETLGAGQGNTGVPGPVSTESSVYSGRASTLNGTCTRTEVELIFVSACITGPKHEVNTKRALKRFQFLDCLISIANVKYIKSGKCTSLAIALEQLMKDHVLAWAEREKPPLMRNVETQEDEDFNPLVAAGDDGSNALKGLIVGEPLAQAGASFRLRFLYTKECDQMLRRYLPQLQRIFSRFSGEENTPIEEKTMSFKEWTTFTDTARLLTEEFLTERMSKLVYVRSKILYEDCFDDSNSFKKVTFLEFLEIVVRAAYAMHLEKLQILRNKSLTEKGSGMGTRSNSTAGLVRNITFSTLSNNNAPDIQSGVLHMVSDAHDPKASVMDLPSEEDAVNGVQDFLYMIELISKKRV